MPRTTDRSFDSFKHININYLPAARPSFLNRLLGTILSLGLLALALTFSLAFFVILACAGLIFAGWLWWKTRPMRKLMRAAAEHAQASRTETGESYGESPHSRTSAPPEARIIEGEVLYRDDDTPNEHKGRLN